jgi:prevent-host-death family protein
VLVELALLQGERLMVQVTIHQAKTHLSELIRRVLAGEEIVIAKGKEPVARLIAIPKARKQRRIGGAAHVIKHMADDFDAPLDEFKEYME